MAFLISSFDSDIPLGCRFFPTDSELIFHLWSMIHEKDYHHHHPSITVYDIYKQEPWLLPWDPARNRYFHGNERYFFVQRKPLSGKDDGTRPKRTIDSGRGWWHANTEDKPIMDEGGGVVGYVKSLTFFVKGENKQKQGKGNRKQEGTKTDWIMHEYVLDRKNVKEWVLCRIRYNGKEPLFMPPVASTSISFDRLPSQSHLFCGGPVPQLPPLKRQKTGVADERSFQEPRDVLILCNNDNLQETEQSNRTESEWSDVCGGVQEQLQQPLLVQPLEEFGQPFAEELDTMLEIEPETEVQPRTLQQLLDECEKHFAEELDDMLEMNSWQEPQHQTFQQQQPLEEYDKHTMSEAPEAQQKQPQEQQAQEGNWQGRIEDFSLNSEQTSQQKTLQQQQQQLVEECDILTMLEPAAQLKPPGKSLAEETNWQGWIDEFWWYLDWTGFHPGKSLAEEANWQDRIDELW
ncbi:hypothetical protein SLE2022_390790 [Rubroshorea leprosula]